MPRLIPLVATKPFDYKGRAFVAGEEFEADGVMFIKIVGARQARRRVLVPPPVSTPDKAPPRRRSPRNRKRS